MSAVFVHDHKFRRIGDNIYSPGGLPNDVLTRYSNWFGKTTVVGRIVEESSAKPSYSLISNPDISIVSSDGLKQLVCNSDIVIARLPSINGYKAVHYAKRFSKPYIVEVVGCAFDSYWNYNFKGKLMSVPAFLIMRHYVRKAPYAVYVTSEFLQKRYPCTGKCVGISDVALESADISVIQRRLEKIKNSDKHFVIGTAGAVDVDYKGQEYVIRALPEMVAKTGLDIKYELVGSGDSTRLRGIAEECGVADRIVFRGLVRHSEIFSWLDSLDAYIQPSMTEGLSRALIEAMSRGLPCMAAQCGGNPELVEKEYIFSKNNKNKIPANIICAFQNLINGNIAETAQRNYNFSNERFKKQSLDRTRDDFYKSVSL